MSNIINIGNNIFRISKICEIKMNTKEKKIIIVTSIENYIYLYNKEIISQLDNNKQILAKFIMMNRVLVNSSKIVHINSDDNYLTITAESAYGNYHLKFKNRYKYRKKLEEIKKKLGSF